MVFIAAEFNVTFTMKHIAGFSNDTADSLSRFHMARFHAFAPRTRQSNSGTPVLANFEFAEGLLDSKFSRGLGTVARGLILMTWRLLPKKRMQAPTAVFTNSVLKTACIFFRLLPTLS